MRITKRPIAHMLPHYSHICEKCAETLFLTFLSIENKYNSWSMVPVEPMINN